MRINDSNDTAYLAGGCFWCVEAVFLRVPGVLKVESGYMGGRTVDPSYKDICKGDTEHAEVIKISFDNNIISYSELLDVFFASHDPTTKNYQGNDVGTQYRSAIFYCNAEQNKIALSNIKKQQVNFYNPIVTEVTPQATFFLAESYHQNYYNLNLNQPYCQLVINPKLKKLNLV